MLVHGLEHSENVLVHVGTEEKPELEKVLIGVNLARAPCASAWP